MTKDVSWLCHNERVHLKYLFRAQPKHKARDILIHFQFIRVTAKEVLLKSILKKDLAPRSCLENFPYLYAVCPKRKSLLNI